jgi:hypothetical protein
MPQRVAFDGEAIPAKKCGFEKVNRGVAVGGSRKKRERSLSAMNRSNFLPGSYFFSGYLVTSRD